MLNIRRGGIFTNNATHVPRQGKDKQGQSGDQQEQWRNQQGQAGTIRTRKGQGGIRNIACPCLSHSCAACPCFSLLVLFIFPAYPNRGPACPCLYLRIPVSSLVPGFVWHSQYLVCAISPFPSTAKILGLLSFCDFHFGYTVKQITIIVLLHMLHIYNGSWSV